MTHLPQADAPPITQLVDTTVSGKQLIRFTINLLSGNILFNVTLVFNILQWWEWKDVFFFFSLFVLSLTTSDLKINLYVLRVLA